MILITKEEYAELKNIFGENMPHVAITNRNKAGRRKKRYMEEDRRAMKILRDMRSSNGYGGN